MRAGLVFKRERIAILLLVGLFFVAGSRAQLLSLFVDGLSSPVFVTHAGDGSGRLFVVEQPGRIRIVENGTLLPTPFLDIGFRVSFGGERGLIGLAFDPAFSQNRRYFVYYYAAGSAQTVLASYLASAADPNISETAETVLLTIGQPFDNHNGGMLAFGPDHFLYVGVGDGGSGGDPQGHGQNLGTLLGAILRLDVSGGTLAIPPDNPFVGVPGSDEIWAYGLRNPWRFSFDRVTGRLFLGDVGQDTLEEVDVIQKGANYGWNIMEGSLCFPPPDAVCDMTGLTLPIDEYGRSIGRSVTGGYLYRGNLLPSLVGRYLFGDFITRVIFRLTETSPGVWSRDTLFANAGFSISSFGEDEFGELYVVDLGGRVFLLSESALCSPPTSGDWVIDQDCTLAHNAVAPGSVTVQDNVTFTISSGAGLDIDLSLHRLTVGTGARVSIKPAGRIF